MGRENQWTDAGGRIRVSYGDAVDHYQKTGDRGPFDEYWRGHRAQEQRIRRAARRRGFRLEKLGSECSNVCRLVDPEGREDVAPWSEGSKYVLIGDQDQVEGWLRA